MIIIHSFYFSVVDKAVELLQLMLSQLKQLEEVNFSSTEQVRNKPWDSSAGYECNSF